MIEADVQKVIYFTCQNNKDHFAFRIRKRIPLAACPVGNQDYLFIREFDNDKENDLACEKIDNWALLDDGRVGIWLKDDGKGCGIEMMDEIESRYKRAGFTSHDHSEEYRSAKHKAESMNT